jgi:hypothetical protein
VTIRLMGNEKVRKGELGVLLKGEDRCRFGLMLLGVDVEMRVITRTHQWTAFDVAKTTLQRIPAKFGKLGGGDITIHGPVTCTG